VPYWPGRRATPWPRRTRIALPPSSTTATPDRRQPRSASSWYRADLLHGRRRRGRWRARASWRAPHAGNGESEGPAQRSRMEQEEWPRCDALAKARSPQAHRRGIFARFSSEAAALLGADDAEAIGRYEEGWRVTSARALVDRRARHGRSRPTPPKNTELVPAAGSIDCRTPDEAIARGASVRRRSAERTPGGTPVPTAATSVGHAVIRRRQPGNSGCAAGVRGRAWPTTARHLIALTAVDKAEIAPGLWTRGADDRRAHRPFALPKPTSAFRERPGRGGRPTPSDTTAVDQSPLVDPSTASDEINDRAGLDHARGAWVGYGPCMRGTQ